MGFLRLASGDWLRYGVRDSTPPMVDLPDVNTMMSRFGGGQPGGVAIVGVDGRWLRVNQYLCDMLGYSDEELLEMTFQEITHPDDLKSEEPYLHKLTAGVLDHYLFRKRYLHKEGHIVWGLLDRSVVRDEANELLYFVSHITMADPAPEPPFLNNLGSAISNWVRGILRAR